MGRLATAGASYIGSAAWWLCDKLWGDQIFAVVKPMIPAWLINGVPLADVVRFVLSFGPPLALFLLGSGLLAWAVIKSRTPRLEKGRSGGPVYWSLAEALSWIAFGKAVTANEWKKDYIQRIPGAADLEKPAFEYAENMLFEALRAETLVAFGKRDAAETYEPIPSTYFLSDVSSWILHDTIDGSANLGTVLARGIPKYRDVRFKREEIRKLWPDARMERERAFEACQVGSIPTPAANTARLPVKVWLS